MLGGYVLQLQGCSYFIYNFKFFTNGIYKVKLYLREKNSQG